MSVGVPTVNPLLQTYSYRLILCVSVNCSYTRDFYQLLSSLRRTGMVFLGTEAPV